ncbi:MAG: TIR domain-containing protein [Methylococcaceae bacterium]
MFAVDHTQELTAVKPERFNWFNWTRLFGYDFFISFTLGNYPRGTQSYASDLARRLREKDFTVFFSEDEASPGEELNSTLLKALHRSRILIVIANEGALTQSKWVRMEVEEFRKKHPKRPVVPINVDDAIFKQGSSVGASEWLGGEDRIWLNESEQAVMNGIASEELMKRLEIAPRFMKSSNRLRWSMASLMLVLSGLTAFSVWNANKAEHEAKIAESQKFTAQAELIISQQPAKLKDGVLLAAKAVKGLLDQNHDSLEASEILQKGLALLPITSEAVNLQAPGFGLIRGHAVFSKGGRYFAASDNGTKIQLIDLQDSKSIRELAHKDSVIYIEFSDDSRYLLSGTWLNDINTVLVWDLANDAKILKKSILGGIGSAAISPDGRYISVAGREGGFVWESATSNEVAKLNGMENITSMQFSPDGKYLALAGSRNASDRKGKEITEDILELRTVGNWGKAEQIKMDKGADFLVFSPNSRYIASASGSHSMVSVWEVDSRVPVARIIHNSGGGVDNITFSSSSTLLASGGPDGTIRLWKIPEGSEENRFGPNGLGYGYVFALSPDEKSIVTAAIGDNVARLWNIDTGKELARLIHAKGVLSTTFLTDGRHIATASSDGFLRIFKVPSISAFEHDYDGVVQAVSFSPNGRFLATLTTAGYDSKEPPMAHVWNFAEEKVVFSTEMDRSEHGQISYRASKEKSISASSDGKFLAAVGYWGVGHVAQVWDTESGHEVFRVNKPTSIDSVSLSPTGIYLSTISDGVGELWDVINKRQIPPTGFKANATDFSPDGKYLAILSRQEQRSRTEIYLLPSGKQIKDFEIADNTKNLVLSQDGRFVATYDGQEIRIWDVNSSAMVHDFKLIGVTSIAFDPTASFLATTTEYGIGQIWNLSVQQEIHRVHHDGFLAAVAFSKDGKYLSTANGYVVLGPGGNKPNPTNNARLWLWRQTDILTDACNKLIDHLPEPKPPLDISIASIQEICPEAYLFETTKH